MANITVSKYCRHLNIKIYQTFSQQPTNHYIPVNPMRSYLNYNFSAWREYGIGTLSVSTHYLTTTSLQDWDEKSNSDFWSQSLYLQYLRFPIPHKPRWFLEIYCIAIQFINLDSLVLAILLLVSCYPPSSIRCSPRPTSLPSPQNNLHKSCTNVEPWERFQPHRGCTAWHSKWFHWMTQLSKVLTPQIHSEAQEGLSWPRTFQLASSLLAKVDFNPKTEEDPKCQGKRQHKKLQNFSGLSLKSWLLWSSPLIVIHEKADRLFWYLLGFKKACISCRKDLSLHCSRITQNWTSYCHSNIIHWRLLGLYITLMALAEYYWQLDAAHRAPVADAYLKNAKHLNAG